MITAQPATTLIPRGADVSGVGAIPEKSSSTYKSLSQLVMVSGLAGLNTGQSTENSGAINAE